MTSRRIRRLLSVLALSGTAILHTQLFAQWAQTAGPGGGSVQCLLATGPTVYAGTSYDGVYRSTDGGSTWIPARAGFVNLDIEAIATNGPSLFAATNSGVHVSIDGGQYWNLLSTSPQGALCLTQSGSYLLAGTSGNGVYVSRDSGANWVQTLTLYTVPCIISGGGRVYAGTLGSGVYSSKDNGLTWNSSSAGLTGGALSVWQFVFQGGSLFAATGGGVYQSTDDGGSWTQAGTGLPGATEDLAGNGSVLVAGTSSQGVYVSTDNGVSWSPANNGLPDLHVKALAWNANRLLVGLGSAGVYTSTNNGVTWAYSCNGIPDGPAMALAVSGTTLIAGGFRTGVFISNDDGGTWSGSNLGLTDPTVTALLVSGQSVFAGTQNGVSRSTNGGVSWTAANAGIAGTNVDALASTPGRVFAAVGTGTGGGVWRSTDNGATWTQVNNGLGSPVQAYCLIAKGSKLFVGTSIGAFVSTDNGDTWNTASTGLGGAPSVSALAADSGGAIFAGVGKDVFKSTNDGAGWSNIGAGISGYGTYTFAIAGVNVFAAFMGGGIYCLTGGGPTWHQENSALGDLYVYALAIRGTTLFAGTAAFGVWRRSLYDMIVPAIPLARTASNVTSGTLTANWNPTAGAKTYRLDLSTDSTFGSFTAGYNALDVGGVTSYPVTGLAPTTTYFYRIRAVNDVGASGNSNTISVRTLQAAPGSPIAWTAAGVTQTSFVAGWGPVAGAGTYRVDVALDNGFATFLAGYQDLDVGADTTLLVPGLTPATDYYYRVRGVNAGGTGPSSNTIRVTTLPVAPGAPVAKAPTNLTSSGFTANWNPVTGASSYDVDVATDAGFASFVGQYNAWNAGQSTSCAVSGVSEATLYYYRVRARNTGGTSPSSNAITATTLRSNPSTYTVSTSVSFGSANKPLNQHVSGDYRLIGIPGNCGQPMSDILGGVQGTDWEIYWDNGVSSTNPTDYYVRLKSGDSRFNASTGRAFWLLHLGDWVLQQRTVNAAPLDTAANAVIPLNTGWNLVTNPFLFSIPWGEITTANGIHDTAYTFSASGWARGSSFDAYSGYLLFNSAGKASLLVPLNSALPKPAPGKPAAGRTAAPGAWSVDVIARSDGRADRTTSFGIRPGALAGLDAFEQRKPRQVDGYPEVYFRRADWDEQYPCFATDFRPPGSTIDVWVMTVRSDNLQPVDLEFCGVEGIPPGSDAMVIDGSAGCARDLKAGPVYRLTPHASSTQIEVAVGTPGAVRALASSVVPVKFALLRNYPNPFNAYTTVPVDIPYQSFVTIDVFDVLGRHVARLFDGEMSGGRHYVRWDGTSLRGGGVASGAYFIRLNVRGGPTLVSAMNMLK